MKRLAIVLPFRVTVPERPASGAPIAEVETQAEERDFWLGHQFTMSEESTLLYGMMEWMLRIPESEWRNPERARIAYEIPSPRRKPKPDFKALEHYLTTLNGPGMVSPGDAFSLSDSDITRVLGLLRSGGVPALNDIYELGIPKSNTERHRLLISGRTAAHYASNPFYPNRFDEFVPFTCIDGVMTPVLATPVLRYWFSERCSHPKYNRGVSFFGELIVGEFFGANDRLIFDTKSGDLWWLDK